MFKWLKQQLLNKKIACSSSRGCLKRFLNHPALKSLDRHSIALGVAIGLFCCILPIFQMIIASILAIVIRANLPLAVLLTWINNPFTFLPITYSTYLVGNRFISENTHAMVIHEFNWKYGTLYEQWSSLTAWLLQFSKPYFVGLIILSVSFGLLGYLFVMMPWERFFGFFKNNKYRS